LPFEPLEDMYKSVPSWPPDAADRDSPIAIAKTASALPGAELVGVPE
jgi:hypothetical protein